MFVNTLALRNYPSGEITFREFLKVVNQRTLEAFDNQDYQFEDLVEKVLTTRDTSRNPLFDVMFGYIANDPISSSKADTGERELRVYSYDYEDTTIKFDMVFGVIDSSGPITFTISFSTEIFKKETIQRFINYFKEIVFIVVENRNIRLKDIGVSHDLQSTDSEVYKVLEKDLEF
jgi:non-ribosomal peptide synthetase component F